MIESKKIIWGGENQFHVNLPSLYSMNFPEELQWRGLMQDCTAGTDELFGKGMVTAYIGFDPTADSLHIGNMVPVMLLQHFQRAGHRPFALVGGATGMIGDPSGKTEERKLLSADNVRHNGECIKKQLEKFLDFTAGRNKAVMVNNQDWFEAMGAIDFYRDVGKYLTISYLLNKGFIKDRLSQGNDISYTEFNYILMQAYDFLVLYEKHDCKLQMGGSDQWGNITAGIELIRKKIRGNAYGITSPLLLKPDGTKFGKTETGNIWLDSGKTSPYRFYQFWLNISDEEAARCVRIFTHLTKEEVTGIEKEHNAAPEKRALQKRIAEILTIQVHSDEACRKALAATGVLFGDSPVEAFRDFSANELEDIFEGVPRYTVSKAAIERGMNIIDLVSGHTSIFPSKSEARRIIRGGGLLVNKVKAEDETFSIAAGNLISSHYILVQKGKKSYYLVKAE